MSQEEEAGSSGCFCVTFYPEGILLVNAEPGVVALIQGVTEEYFPGGVKESVSSDAGAALMIKVHQSKQVNSSEAGNMIYSNAGKILCCNLLSRLNLEGWSVVTTGNLDSICVYNLPEEVYPSTTWFFQRNILPAEQEVLYEAEEEGEEGGGGEGDFIQEGAYDRYQGY